MSTTLSVDRRGVRKDSVHIPAGRLLPMEFSERKRLETLPKHIKLHFPNFESSFVDVSLSKDFELLQKSS